MARAGGRGVGGDYSREATILNISVKGGDYSKEARRLIEGRLLFEEIRTVVSIRKALYYILNLSQRI